MDSAVIPKTLNNHLYQLQFQQFSIFRFIVFHVPVDKIGWAY